MTDELKPKPCPWCGCEAGIGFMSPGGQDSRIFTKFACLRSECNATGPYRIDEQEAIAAWNRIEVRDE